MKEYTKAEIEIIEIEEQDIVTGSIPCDSELPEIEIK